MLHDSNRRMDTIYLCQEKAGPEGCSSTTGPRGKNFMSSLYEISTKEIDVSSLYALRISSQ